MKTSNPMLLIRIRDPVPFLTPNPGSEIGFTGSRISNQFFEELVKIFWVESSLILCKLAQIFSSSIQK
jgi:hypothetical protein